MFKIRYVPCEKIPWDTKTVKSRIGYTEVLVMSIPNICFNEEIRIKDIKTLCFIYGLYRLYSTVIWLQVTNLKTT